MKIVDIKTILYTRRSDTLDLFYKSICRYLDKQHACTNMYMVSDLWISLEEERYMYDNMLIPITKNSEGLYRTLTQNMDNYFMSYACRAAPEHVMRNVRILEILLSLY